MLIDSFNQKFPTGREVSEGPGIRRYRQQVANELATTQQQLFEWVIGKRSAKWAVVSDWWCELSTGYFDHRNELTGIISENIDCGYFTKEMIDRWQLISDS